MKFVGKVHPAGESSSAERRGQIKSPSRASSVLQIFGQTCEMERNREEGVETGRSVSLEARCSLYWRGVLLPGQPAGRDWYLEQRSSGIAADDLMFGTHLASTNTSHLFPVFLITACVFITAYTIPLPSNTWGRQPISFHCLALVLREPQAVV